MSDETKAVKSFAECEAEFEADAIRAMAISGELSHCKDKLLEWERALITAKSAAGYWRYRLLKAEAEYHAHRPVYTWSEE